MNKEQCDKLISLEDKKILKSMYWRSGLVMSGFNLVKMEGNAFCATMSPCLKKLYIDENERRKALLRHNGFFNTNAVLFPFIAGLTYALEKEKMEKGSVDDDAIENIKVSLMGPCAGIGDALFFNSLRIIVAGISMGFAAQGNILGPILFILLYGGTQMFSRWKFLNIGFTMGTSFIDRVFSSGLMNSLTKSASILGLSMVGAMVSKMVNVKLKWTIDIGKSPIVVLDVINSIMPNLLSILLLFSFVYLLKKGYKPITLVIGVLVVSVLLSSIGVF
ncbi:PTS sugar transporter subunit IID [Citrobacter youngae]|nr:PTS sugar transporter subunit IID [Citrobacter youngae]